MYKGYDFFYTIGSSHTAAGGLSPNTIYNEYLPCYQEIMAKDLLSLQEPMNSYSFSWSKRLSNIIGIPVVNEARGGASTTRSVRKTYEFVEKHIGEKFFVVFEVTEPESRTEIFLTENQEHCALNIGWKDKHVYAALEATPSDELTAPNNHGIFLEYFQRHIDVENLRDKNERDVLGLYSFLKNNNIPVKLMIVDPDFLGLNRKRFFDKNDIISLNQGHGHIHYWAHNLIVEEPNKGFLKNIDYTQERFGPIWYEIPGRSDDGHPGYFAHRKYAEELRVWLDNHLEPME